MIDKKKVRERGCLLTLKRALTAKNYRALETNFEKNKKQ